MKFWSILIIAAFALAVPMFSGCAKAAGSIANVAHVSNTDNNENSETREKRIVQALLDFEEIENCNVYITGKTAVVGISLTLDIDDNALINLKHRISNKTKSTDTDINHVAISTSADIYRKIDEMIPDTPAEREIEEELEKLKENSEINFVPTL